MHDHMYAGQNAALKWQWKLYIYIWKKTVFVFCLCGFILRQIEK